MQSSHVYGGDPAVSYRAVDVVSCPNVEITARVLRGGDGGADYWGEGEYRGPGILGTPHAEIVVADGL